MMRARLDVDPDIRLDPGRGFDSLVVAVDDTDDMTKETSTGAIAALIAAEGRAMGGVMRLEITRHQLLLREDVPYTSHNSSMAFELLLPEGRVEEFRERAVRVIAENRAQSSDPGLCIAVVPRRIESAGVRALQGSTREGEQSVACENGATLAQKQLLERFGERAKVEYCSKEDAYALAGRISWVSLSEHGGDGMGVVGALAGVGLRMGGRDGRFRGKWDLAQLCQGDALRPVDGPGGEGARKRGSQGAGGDARRRTVPAAADVSLDIEDYAVMPVGQAAAILSSKLRGEVVILDATGAAIDADVPLALMQNVKPVLAGGALALVCDIAHGVAVPCSKVDLGEIGNVEGSWSRVCALFEWDNDIEEFIDESRSCRNCLYRRWTERGFLCVKR